MENGKLEDLKALQGVTSIKPSRYSTQKGYITFIQEDRFNLVRELQEITRIRPPKKIVQERHRTYLQRGALGYLSMLMHATKIYPHWEDILQGYRFFLQELKKAKEIYSILGALDQMKSLCGMVLNVPPEDVIQEAYMVCVKKGLLDKLNELQEVTGIKPSEKVQRALINEL
jgi:cob(I)alamin adenosyltransferase